MSAFCDRNTIDTGTAAGGVAIDEFYLAFSFIAYFVRNVAILRCQCCMLIRFVPFRTILEGQTCSYEVNANTRI